MIKLKRIGLTLATLALLNTVSVAGIEEGNLNPLRDQDQDGLTDLLEERLQTDLLKWDTDEDGLSDGYEVKMLGSHPLKIDTDDNGVSDAEEDGDSDGLSNLEEMNLETDPCMSDTDLDELSDFEETTHYKTNPLEGDTDRDGILDGKEVLLNLEPLKSTTDKKGIEDAEKIVTFETGVMNRGEEETVRKTEINSQIVAKLNVTIRGKDLEKISFTALPYEHFKMKGELPVYITEVYEFVSEADYEKADLVLDLSQISKKRESLKPVIYTLNENEENFETLKQQHYNEETAILTGALEAHAIVVVLDQNELDQFLLTNEPKDLFEDSEIGKMSVLKDSDSDGIEDSIDPEPNNYSVSDRTLALNAALSYNNLKKYMGKTIETVRNEEGKLLMIGMTHSNDLKNAIVVHSNDSGFQQWKDFWDGGLGSCALKIRQINKPDVIVFSFRGTEPTRDALSDFVTDGLLGLGFDSFQSKTAFNEYRVLAKQYPNAKIYLSGHSLGGRLTQDVMYHIYKYNKEHNGGIKEPEHGATFNALGYNVYEYHNVDPQVASTLRHKMKHYYYNGDLVGEGFGNSSLFKRLGTDLEPWTAKDKNGNPIPLPWISKVIKYAVVKIHYIELFLEDSNLKYPRIEIRN